MQAGNKILVVPLAGTTMLVQCVTTLAIAHSVATKVRDEVPRNIGELSSQAYERAYSTKILVWSHGPCKIWCVSGTKLMSALLVGCAKGRTTSTWTLVLRAPTPKFAGFARNIN